MILLDTDHFSVFRFEEHPRAAGLRVRLQLSGDPRVATTIITFEEQMRGWMAEIHRRRDLLDQVVAYDELTRMVEQYRRWTIIRFDESAAHEFGGLRRQHRRLGAQDLKNAAIALANNALLLSANLRDFRHISRLRVENWLAIPASGGGE